MVDKHKPKLGWQSGGFSGTFQFDCETAKYLSEEISGLPLQELEVLIADYIMWRANEEEKPKVGQQKANTLLLQETTGQLIGLLHGPLALDDVTQDHLLDQLGLNGVEFLSGLRRDLERLWNASLSVQNELDKAPGRPQNEAHYKFAWNLSYLFEKAGIKPTTTQTGAFVRSIEIVFQALGEKTEDGHTLAKKVLNHRKRENGG